MGKRKNENIYTNIIMLFEQNKLFRAFFFNLLHEVKRMSTAHVRVDTTRLSVLCTIKNICLLFQKKKRRRKCKGKKK